MLTVDQYARIRQLRRDGLTIRQIAQQLGHSSKTVLKALEHPEPLPRRPVPAVMPVFGPVQKIVDEILTADATAPRKQRHTAAQIYRRLVAEHGYTGSYDPIRRYLQSRRLDQRDTFIPLEHRPGVRLEADFGHIHVDLPEGRRLVPVLIATWSYSNAPFAIALPTERTEAVLHGLVEAFAFFGCVPRELWWDNPATVALHVLRGRERVLHPRYVALASHYTFAPKFCMPAAPTEKPRVENRVKDLERMWATPVPRVSDLAELNDHLRRCCVAAQERTCGHNTQTVAARFAQDRTASLAVPARAFDPCISKPGQVDKYQIVRFDDNRYSVPRRWAFRPVTVKGYIDRVVVVAEGQEIAAHRRSYGRHEAVLDPLHFLAILPRKPAALDHAPVLRDWHLPPEFARLRQALEAGLGARTGVRHFIRVLQLLAHHPQERVARAIALVGDRADAAAVVTTVERLSRDAAPPAPGSDNALSLVLPLPDLSRFDLLLSRCSSHGGSTDARSEPVAAQEQPEATQAADDGRRVGEAGP